MSVTSVSMLVRKLVVTNNEGRDSILPLTVIKGTKNGNILENVSMIPFERELADTIYIPELHLTQTERSDKYKLSDC